MSPDVDTADVLACSHMPSPQVFISAGGVESPALTALGRELRRRGLRVWESDNIGTHPADSLRHALDTAIDAAIVFISPYADHSETLLTIELPAIRERHRRDQSFPIIPIYAASRHTWVNSVGLAVGLPLTMLGPIELAEDDPTWRGEQLGPLALRLARAILGRYLERIPSDEAFSIDIFSRTKKAYSYPAVLQLDWEGALDPTPAPAAWDSALWPALRDLRYLLSRYPARPIALRPASSHLSFGLAFGFTFSATSGYQLWVQQHTSGRPAQWWRTDQPAASEPPLLVKPPIAGDPAARDITVEISITKLVTEDVTRWIGSSATPIMARVQLQPLHGLPPSNISDSAQALAAARQVSEVVNNHRRHPGTIHLFGAIPIGLAVLIGSQLNASGPVQCYEHDDTSATYHPACLLRGRV